MDILKQRPFVERREYREERREKREERRAKNESCNLEMKYKMDFEVFKANNMVEQKGYSLEVENDFCDWEMALDEVNTVNRKMK